MKASKLNIALVLLLSSMSIGCQSMMTSSSQAVPTTDKIVVQIRRANGKPKNVEVDLKPNMRLQDVVKASKANFRNKIAYIVRTSPTTGQQHKLEGSFDSNRRISLETDYAIQPGDRVVIAQDTTSSFDRVVKSMLGRS